MNHNETAQQAHKGPRIKSGLKAGVVCRSCNLNHNETAQQARKGPRIKSGIKAGGH
jgi:hypothetical protein